MRSLVLALALFIGPAFADRLDVSINGNYAYFKATGPHPFVLLTPNISAK